MNIVVKAFLAYLEKHPEVIEQLIERLVAEIIRTTAPNA